MNGRRASIRKINFYRGRPGVEGLVLAILYDPVSAVDFKQALSVGLTGASAGDAIGDFRGAFAALVVDLVLRSIT
jgi:hypothetical protein